MFTKKTMGAMVGITSAGSFCATIFANKIFSLTDKIFSDKGILS
jgi:hypothetical protein